MDFEELIDVIFSSPPTGENSIQLGFTNDMEVNDLFEFLLSFFTNGSKKKFSNIDGTVNVRKWSDVELTTMKKYCKSIGYDCNINIIKYPESSERDFSLDSYKKMVITKQTQLRTLKLPLKINQDVVIISFDILDS
jgi:hypothetical protein